MQNCPLGIQTNSDVWEQQGTLRDSFVRPTSGVFQMHNIETQVKNFHLKPGHAKRRRHSLDDSSAALQEGAIGAEIRHFVMGRKTGVKGRFGRFWESGN